VKSSTPNSILIKVQISNFAFTAHKQTGTVFRSKMINKCVHVCKNRANI